MIDTRCRFWEKSAGSWESLPGASGRIPELLFNMFFFPIYRSLPSDTAGAGVF